MYGSLFQSKLIWFLPLQQLLALQLLSRLKMSVSRGASSPWVSWILGWLVFSHMVALTGILQIFNSFFMCIWSQWKLNLQYLCFPLWDNPSTSWVYFIGHDSPLDWQQRELNKHCFLVSSEWEFRQCTWLFSFCTNSIHMVRFFSALFNIFFILGSFPIWLCKRWTSFVCCWGKYTAKNTGILRKDRVDLERRKVWRIRNVT